MDLFLGPRFLWRSSFINTRHTVGFGGLGEVVPGGNQPFRTKNFLPAGGGGVWFALNKTHHVNLRVDFAQGKDTHTWSVGVGEAF